MTEVVSIKFKNRGKSYCFSPEGLSIQTGDCVIVETSKGLEIADCVRGNHEVEDSALVQPLRPVVRIATQDDRRVAEINKSREKEAFEICQQKIAEHGLDMKLVDVECSFEGSKTTFFFTSDGRVDFRELVKDLAGIFRNRIELRQIGVRDEAKMLGGIGICGRPYCCHQFLEEFQPVSTKMAKVQSLSLNPAKISGSCGRLMCCLRYEQDAYEDLIKSVPKQGAFVQTKDGYGTAVQVNLLRQTVRVKLDEDSDDTLHTYRSNELASVPGGRPKDGEPLPDVFTYIPEPEEKDDEVNEWELPSYTPVENEASAESAAADQANEKKRSNRRRRSGKGGKTQPAAELKAEPKAEAKPEVKAEVKAEPKPHTEKKPNNHRRKPNKPKAAQSNTEPKAEEKKQSEKQNAQHAKATVKPVKQESKAESKPAAEAKTEKSGSTPPKKNNRRRYYHNSKPKAQDGSR